MKCAKETSKAIAGLNQYRCNKKSALGALGYCLCFGFATILSIWMFWDSFAHPGPTHRDTGIAVMCTVTFGTMLAGSLYMLALASTVYDTDEEAITQRCWGRVRRMRWQDIIRIDEGSGAADASLKLTDVAGNRIGIEFSTLENNAPGLRSTVDAKLKQLKDRQIEDFVAGERSVPAAPSWSIWLVVVISLGLLVLTRMAYDPVKDRAQLPIFVLIGSIFVMLIGLAAWAGSRKIVWSEHSISQVGPRSTKSIAWSEVDSVFLYESTSKNGKTELLTIKSGERKMVLASSMPQYAVIRAAILSRVPAECIRNGESDREDFARRQQKMVSRSLSVCSVLLVLLGIAYAVQPVTKINKIRYLASRGIATTAIVTGREGGCSENTLEDIVYRFEVHGYPYTGENQAGNCSLPIHIGDAVPVRYLEENPNVSRLTALLDWRPILWQLGFFELLLLLYPALIVYYRIRSKRKSVAK